MRIGVIRYWADRPAAEHEVISRMAAAATARGHRIVELHPDGSLLDSSDVGLTPDFVLNLHFATPKNLDLPHVGALWNPVRFYHHFGFAPHFANQLSHDYLATCGSRFVDRAFEPFRPELFEAGLPILNHTVPERYLEPVRRTDRSVFYVGINWERMSGAPGRHDTLLRLLDAKGMSAIHGPEEIDGIRPWEAFQTYKGQLPFDGWSVVQAISDAGAALVVSSSEHYRDGVMSCRPFEAAAAGVPLISERHPFMVEHFADAALFFDERAPAADQADEIGSLVAQLNADPDHAVALAARAQALVRSDFNLDSQLDGLCSWVAQRENARVRPATVPATAVVVPVRPSAQVADWLVANRHAISRFSEVVLAPPVASAEWSDMAERSDPSVRVVVGTRADTTWSERASRASADLSGPVCFLTGTEELWQRYPDDVATCSGDAMLIPAIAQDDLPERAANERIPTLLCGRTSEWFNLPVASIAVSAEYLRVLNNSLGPGLHLGVAADVARGCDDDQPVFEPAFSVAASEARIWTVDSRAGEERSRDGAFIAALPSSARPTLPSSVTDRPSRPSEGERLVPADFVLPEAGVRVATGFSHVEEGDGDRWWWATEPIATLHVANASEDPRVGTLEFVLQSLPSDPGRMLTVLLPGGVEHQLQARGQSVSLQLTAPPGRVSTVEFRSEGDPANAPGDQRDLWWQFRSPTLYLRTAPGRAPVREVFAPREEHVPPAVSPLRARIRTRLRRLV